jgi:hypothetical protein
MAPMPSALVAIKYTNNEPAARPIALAMKFLPALMTSSINLLNNKNSPPMKIILENAELCRVLFPF